MSAPDAVRPLLLAIDTASRQYGLGLYDGGPLAALTWPTGRRGDESALPALEALLGFGGRRLAEVGAIAVALGPGPFSSLRVGLSLAKGLALATSAVLVGVRSLDLVSYPQRHARQTVWAVLDAGRERVVAQPFSTAGGTWGASAPPYQGSAGDLIERMVGPALVVGDLGDALRARLGERHDLDVLEPALCSRSPAVLAELGWQRWCAGAWDDDASLEPIYRVAGSVGGSGALRR